MTRRAVLLESRTIRQCAAAASCALAVLSMTSCSIAPKPVGAPRTTSTTGGRAAFEPVELRIHPLTRIRASETGGDTAGPGGGSVDLYFELLDKWGHGVKALGTLTIELRSVSAGGQREPFQVRSWTVVLTDPGTNSAAFDRVTRTYHIGLEDIPIGSDGSELLVRFRTSGAKQISATYELR